jgi:hypothetical protein
MDAHPSQEASMQRAFDRLNQQENRTQWKWTAGFAAACGVILFVALMSNSPAASNWISEAAQAEFAASTMTPDAAPVQIAAGRTR